MTMDELKAADLDARVRTLRAAVNECEREISAAGRQHGRTDALEANLARLSREYWEALKARNAQPRIPRWMV